SRSSSPTTRLPGAKQHPERHAQRNEPPLPVLHSAGKVGEFGVVLEERELDLADRPAAVFGDMDLGDATLRRVRVVDLVPVDEHDYIGILFDGIVSYDPIGDEAVRPFDREIERWLVTDGRDLDHLIPVEI